MIESIELINWKTHKHTELKFQKGVNVLIGVMGAGKSSVMDALSFALFGTFPALTHKRTSTKELISNRPTIEENAEVKLKISVGSDNYTLSRKISKGESTTSKIEKNGKYLQTQTERVNEETASILKVDYETFARAIYAEQNRLDYFLELAKGERKRQIDQMLGLDSFARAEENTTSLVNSVRSTIKEGESTLAQLDVSHYKKELARLTTERKDLEADLKANETKAKSLKEDIKGVDAKLAEAKAAEKKREALSKELEGMKSRTELLSREIEKIGKQEKEASKLEAELTNLKSAQERAVRETKLIKAEESLSIKKIATLEADIKNAGDKLAELAKIKEELAKDPIEQVEKRLKALQEELDGATKEAAMLDGRKAEAEKAVSELERHISKCPICERELTPDLKERLLAQKNELAKHSALEISKLKAKAEELSKKIKLSRGVYDKASTNTKRMEEYTHIRSSLSKFNEALSEEKKKHLTLSAKLEGATSDGERLAKELNSVSIVLEAVKRRESYTKENEILKKGISKKQEELDAIGERSKEIDALHRQLLASNNLLTDANSKIESSSKYLKSLDAQIDEKAKSIAKVSNIEEKLSKMRDQVSTLNKFKGALVETESTLRSRLIHSINSLMQEVWLQIYPYGDYTAIKLNAGKDDYGLEVATNSNGEVLWNDLNGMASGGERSIACLAMRIAMSMVIVPNLRWLILDEPTHNIDENGISKLVYILGETLPSIVEQVFIITHDSALKNITGARIYQLDRDKGKNEYTSYAEL